MGRAEITKPEDVDYYLALMMIRELTPYQQDVLGNICINRDQGHRPKTLEILCRKGLIFPYEGMQANPEGRTIMDRIPLKIVRFGYTIPVHMAWCRWASKDCGREAEDASA